MSQFLPRQVPGKKGPLAQKVPQAPSFGGEEIVVNVYDKSIQRIAPKGLTRAQFIEYWDNNELGFQVEGKPRPESVPSRDDASNPSLPWKKRL